MARVTVEDSLKNIKNASRFQLVKDVIKLAYTAPIGSKIKPAVWALKMIAEGRTHDKDTV